MKKIVKNEYKKFFKNNILKLILITILFFVFFQEFKIFRNTYYLINKNYYQRAIDAYENTFFSGYCRGSSHGYLFYIKEKYSKRFDKDKMPKIINNFNERKEYWIFLNVNAEIDENQLIVLNNMNNIDFQKYEIIDQIDNKCFFVEKKND